MTRHYDNPARLQRLLLAKAAAPARRTDRIAINAAVLWACSCAAAFVCAVAIAALLQ